MEVVADALEMTRDAAAADHLRGLRWANLHEHEMAAECFLAALKADATQADRLVEHYLESMTQMGKAVTGYRSASDFGQPLSHFLSRLDSADQPSAEELLRITELHEKEFPDDPEMHYLRAAVLFELQDLDNARASLNRAHECNDDDEGLGYRMDRLLDRIALLQNRATDRYDECGGSEAVFVRLANGLLDRGQVDSVKTLLRQHLQQSPASDSTRRIEARIAESESDPDRAISIFESLVQSGNDPDGKATESIARLYASRGDWQNKVRESSDPLAFASTLAEHFIRSGQWEQLDALIQLSGETGVSPVACDWWRIRLGVHQQDEQAIAAAAARSAEQIWSDYDFEIPFLGSCGHWWRC